MVIYEKVLVIDIIIFNYVLYIEYLFLEKGIFYLSIVFKVWE